MQFTSNLILSSNLFPSPIWSCPFSLWTKILYASQLPPSIVCTCHHTWCPKIWKSIQIILMLLIIPFSPISVTFHLLHPYIIPQIMVSNILQFYAFLSIRYRSFIHTYKLNNTLFTWNYQKRKYFLKGKDTVYGNNITQLSMSLAT